MLQGVNKNGKSKYSGIQIDRCESTPIDISPQKQFLPRSQLTKVNAVSNGMMGHSQMTSRKKRPNWLNNGSGVREGSIKSGKFQK